VSNDVIISAENVGKKFSRSLKRTLVYGVQDVARDVFGIAPQSETLRRDEFWALNNVSFEIKRGECLGLIGANGAGKSTLLKLLNGVILPDKGTIRVHGRVGGLLELGAGFHPMLTGRENIHLSGAILGLNKEEVEEKFDSIVDFADLWDSIDAPVKYYSSGMYVRLGFSIAISIDPDILIVDESMAVGDTAFKKRCLNRIETFIKAGKTIIVVTHNLQEIERIARRVILLDHGVIHADGLTDEVIGNYLRLLSARPRQARREVQVSNGKQDKAVIEIAEIDLCDHAGQIKCCFRTHDELQVSIKFVAHQPIVNPVFRVQIYRDDGVFCHGMNTERHGINLGQFDGIGIIVLRYTDLRLLSGDYSVRVSVLLSQYDEFPLHELVASQGIRIESKMKDGGGIFAMPTEWILSRFDDD
jgi:lipopolysaccharide transport system ATP-binding protein